MTLAPSFRLRTRLALLGLIATAPALVVLLYTQALERARARDTALSDSRKVTQLAASEQAIVFDGVQRLLLTLAKLPDIQSDDPARCRALLPGVLRDHPGYINIWVNKISHPDFCVAAPVADTSVAAAERQTLWFRQAIATRTTVVGDFHISPTNGMPDVVLAHPIVDAGNGVQGIVAAAVSLDQLNDIAARAQLLPGTTLTLIDRQRRVLARYPGGAAPGQVMPEPPASSLVWTEPVRGNVDTGLQIAMAVDRDAEMAGADGLLRRQALLLVVLFAATVVVSILGGDRFVRRPITALADVTRRLAAGDLSARAHVGGGAPGVDDLAAAINTMATTMETRSQAEAHAQQELRESEERLRHAQKLETVGQLAAGVAHNFNNLLTVVAGFTELLMARHSEGVDRSDLEEIKKAASRGAVLTRQLLAFSRRHDSAPAKLDLNLTISELRDMLSRIIREDITLQIALAPSPAWVLIDPHEVEQILLNLVLNARDAMPTGGTIAIEIAHAVLDAATAPAGAPDLTGWHVCLSVSDTGTGMSPEVRAHLFEPFFTTKDATKGTGMGLASVDAIVRQNRGAIAIETEPGAGSTFRVYLPAVSADLAVPELPPREAPPQPAAKTTILLVEDEDPLRAVVARMLGQAGYHVLDARTPSEARRLFDEHHEQIGLLLTDVIMPEMNGPALAQRLVALRPELRVLFVSGYTEELPVLNAPGGKSRFLPKPFSSATLVAAVTELLERAA